MAIDPNATAKDYSLIIYNKTEIDGFNSAETIRVDSKLDTKSDKADEGSPSGIAQLSPEGKHVVNQIPISSVAEAEDAANATTVMTPQRVNYLIETKTVEQSQIGIADGVAPLGVGAKIDPIYLPPAQIVNTYVVNLLADMYALVASGNVVHEGDRCIVVAEADPLNNGEYVANIDSPIDITGWHKIPNLSAVSSINGSTGDVVITSIAESIDNAARLNTVEAAVISNTADIALKASQTDVDDIGLVISLLTTEVPANTTAIATNVTNIAAMDTRVTTLESKDIVSLNTVSPLSTQTLVSFAPEKLFWASNALVNDGGTSISYDISAQNILIAEAGVYRVYGTISAVAREEDLVAIEMYVNGVPTGIASSNVGRGGAMISYTYSFLTSFAANDNINLYVTSTGTEITIQSASITVEKTKY